MFPIPFEISKTRILSKFLNFDYHLFNSPNEQFIMNHAKMKPYEKKIDIAWADLDPNGHVRHSCYYEYGANIRISFFADYGFDTEYRNQHKFGPVLFKEECTFIKELMPKETIRVNMLKGNVSEDASRWELHHEIFNQKGEKCAHITITGAWIDLNLRKLTIPPPLIAEAFSKIKEGERYVYKKKKGKK